MTELSIEEKIALSTHRFQKSKEALSDAESNFNGKTYKTSVNRSYYAVLHTARSLLILKGVDPLRHEGVVTMLSLHFIKSNLLPTDCVRIFKHLLSMRTDVDYGDFDVITMQDAEDAVQQAKRFIEIVAPVREHLIRELNDSRPSHS